MHDMTFTGKTRAHVRDGRFTLSTGTLYGALLDQQQPGTGICWLDLFSSISGTSAPISLRFNSPEDLRTLGLALLEAAECYEDAIIPEIPDEHHTSVLDEVMNYQLEEYGLWYLLSIPGVMTILEMHFRAEILATWEHWQETHPSPEEA